MRFSDEEIRRQIRLGEDSHWEFKEIEFAGDVPKSPRRDDLAFVVFSILHLHCLDPKSPSGAIGV